MESKVADNYLKKELYELIKSDESIFDFIQESSLDGLWYWDIENPENEWMNPKFWTVLGYNPDEMPHKSSAWQNIINPDDLKVALDNFTKHCENPDHPYDQVVRYTHKNGSTTWIHCRGIAIRDENGKPVRMLGAHHDISAIKNAEIEFIKAKELAEESSLTFRNVFEYSGIGMALVNTQKRIIKVNKLFCGMLEYSEEELQNKTIQDITYPEDEVIGQNEMAACIKGKLESFSVSKRYVTKTGRIVWGNLNVAIVRGTDPSKSFFIAQIVDVTRQIEYQQSLVQAKELTEENERKYRLVFENAHDYILVISADSKGRPILVDANRAAFDYYGYTREEMIGRNINDFETHESAMRFPERIKLFKKSGDSAVFEADHVRKDGTIFTVEAKATMIQSENQSPLFVSIERDITEKRKAQEEIIHSKEKAENNWALLLNITDNIPAYVAAVDINTLEYQFVNEKFETSFGKSREQIIGTHISKIIGQENYDFALQYIEQARQGKPASYVNRFDLKEGSRYIHVNYIPGYSEKGNLDKILVLSFDITEQKHFEEELNNARLKAEESENKYKSLFTNMMNAFGLHEMIFNENGEPVDYVFLEVNPIWEKVVGIEASAVIGKGIREIMPTIEQSWIDRYAKIVKTGIPDDFIDYNEATQKYYNVFAYKLEGNKFAVVFNDVTERKNFELELIKAKGKAEESDRLKTAFLQNMSHEIRTPLNAISGFTGLLDEPDLNDEKRKSFVQIIQNSSNQLISIVSDILTISSLETKQEEVNISRVNINNILIELLNIFKQQALNQNISLYTKQQLSDKQSEIFTDRTKITQILSNLLSNALKFTHKGFIEFGYNQKGNELEFFVRDSGIGIKPEMHEKIFERFRQADKSIHKIYGGTGLGLAISKAFTELLGGKIRVDSELEKGSTFYFTVPYKPVNPADPSTNDPRLANHQKTILIADDEEYNFLLIQEYLSDFGLNLIHTKDGRETVEVFKSNPGIELILMDIKMPVLDGYEAARLIKELKTEQSILAQSAYALEHEIAKFETVFDDYLTKPISKNDLRQKVVKYIGVKH
jgi:PAS domain S-box-containing protein